jgi:hypothetical protein
MSKTYTAKSSLQFFQIYISKNSCSKNSQFKFFVQKNFVKFSQQKTPFQVPPAKIHVLQIFPNFSLLSPSHFWLMEFIQKIRPDFNGARVE